MTRTALALVPHLVASLALFGCAALADDDEWTDDRSGAGKADDPSADGPRLVFALDGSHHTRTITDPEVDCFWQEGYTHFIAGTQVPAVTRQQLDVAIRGGMTVDLYIYLYWHYSTRAQVEEALAIAADYPEVKTIWLDLEQAPGGKNSGELIAMIDDALAAAGAFPVGIYTGIGFWHDHMDNTTAYADLPLWYARYDLVASMDTYQPGGAHAFGGWNDVVGKQFDDHIPGVCDRAVDKNVMLVGATPTVSIDRSPVADDGNPPEPPTDLLPDGGRRIITNYVRPTAMPNRRATEYEFHLENWTGTQFNFYWKKRTPVSAMTLFPVIKNAAYRWRVRARNEHGYGDWSPWAWFQFGEVNKPPPADAIDD